MARHILALETAGFYGSVAVADGPVVLHSAALAPPRRTAQGLAPLVAQVLAEVAWRPHDIELVAVTIGPGSFTGLRVGVVTAKTLAYATGAAVVGINTLAAIAWQSPAACLRVGTVLDAQRQQLFSATWQRTASGRWENDSPTQLYDNDDWLRSRQPGDVVTGSGLTRLAAHLPAGVVSLPPTCWEPTAAAVAALAHLRAEDNALDTHWTLVPQYYRLSAAEEKRAAR
ncbi:MAG: tRNA (adenosine(37)-N6)-threonylcarbamoyltransferase complex dimerization subunit type 1 TsaB [Pirellulales bacterium]